MAIFYTKLHKPAAPPPRGRPAAPGPARARDASRVIDRQVSDYISRARLEKAA